VFSRGENYYQTGKVVDISHENDGALSTVVVNGNYKNYKVTFSLDSLGNLEDYRCDCQSSLIWRGACKHVIAGLIAIFNERNETDSRTLMDNISSRLVNELEKQIYREIDESIIVNDSLISNQKQRFEAQLFLAKKHEPYLNFSIGNSRLYIIKNIHEFVENMNNQAMVSFGKHEFRHALDAFDSNCRGLLEFVIHEDMIHHQISRSIVNNSNHMLMMKENARNLPIYERNADEFFELYIDKELNTDVGVIRVTDESLPINFEVEIQNEMMILKGNPMFLNNIDGTKYKYFLIEGAFHRVDKNRGLILEAIIESLNKSESHSITFRNHELDKFMSVILPYLKRENLIEDVVGLNETEDLTSHPLIPKLYFDSKGKEVLCKLLFCYDDIKINAIKQQERVFNRDIPYEYRVKRHLEAYGFEPDEELGFYKLRDSDFVYNLLSFGLDELENIAEIYVDEKLLKLKPRAIGSNMGLKLAGDLLEVSLDDSEFSFHDLIDALESFRIKKRYHRLEDGRFINLEDKKTNEIAHIINSLDLSKEDVDDSSAKLPLYRSLYIDELTDSIESVERGMDFQKLALEIRKFKDICMSQPTNLQGNLREYQVTGFNWLASLSRYGFGGILADDMGLGKTIQVISFLLNAHEPGLQSLVVAPSSLLYNWLDEIKRFAPSLVPAVIAGTPEKRAELLGCKADVYITTYDMLKRDLELYSDKNFETLSADEAQFIKNPKTLNAKAIKQIKSKNRFALTGTPIENSLTELWSIFDFILPGYLYTYRKFSKLYEVPIVKDDDKERAEALQKQISPFLLRRMKSEVLTELPKKTVKNLYAELLYDQKRLYTAHMLKTRGLLELETGFSNNRMKILAQLTLLRQICCHPALFIEDYSGSSGKLTLALETIQMAIDSGHRILLFSQFTSMLSILMKELDTLNLSYFYLDGGVASAARLDMSNRFNSGERDLFLISMKAGGTGLNLTGADVVIHYDPWWNPAVMDQASDRAHRFGQKNPVQVFNLVTRDTIEQKIMDLHDKKRNLVDSVISEGGHFLSAMSETEIVELFRS
jgi:SNF2 family DNA or RNA helicase